MSTEAKTAREGAACCITEDRGLDFCQAAATRATPAAWLGLPVTAERTVAMERESSLKAAFWQGDLREKVNHGDPNYLTLVSHQAGARVWRNQEPTPAEVGAIGMLPFDTSCFRLEGPIAVLHVYVPFALLGAVCNSLFDRDLTREQLWIPMGARDERMHGVMNAVHARQLPIEPSRLLLDSWALILSEILVRRFSSYSHRYAHISSGKIPLRSIARVIDHIEAGIGQDLTLASLATVAAMSAFHFARRFKKTVGISPHAYVLSRRIGRAQEMLKRGGCSIAQVAAACGFSSQAHITTAFRRSLGMTPGEYRRAVSS